MGLETDIYTYRRLPWLSKSTILGYRFCQYLFDLRYNKGQDYGVNIKAETGTNMHVLYKKFFDEIDYKILESFVLSYIQNIEETEVFKYFFKIMMELIPVESRAFKPYQTMVKNFAMLEADHWITLNREYKENRSSVLKYFLTLAREKYNECPVLQIFGTIDRKALWGNGKDVIILYDYKTGHIPNDVKKGKKTEDNFSWTIPTKRSFELHFYLILEMCAAGYSIHPDIVDFCTKDKWFYKDAKIPKVDNYFFNKQGDAIKPRDFYRVGIIYTGGDQPYVPKKYPAKRSFESVFKWINKIRTVIKMNGPFNKEPTYWKCRECNDVVRDECLNEQEKKMIFWGSDNELSK